jgi:hypothetical protein
MKATTGRWTATPEPYGGSDDERERESLQDVDKGHGLERSFFKRMDLTRSESAGAKAHEGTALSCCSWSSDIQTSEDVGRLPNRMASLRFVGGDEAFPVGVVASARRYAHDIWSLGGFIA